MRDRIVLRQRVADQKRHKRIHDEMPEMRQEHEYPERFEDSTGHGCALQSCVDEPRGGPKRASAESLL